MEDNIHKGHRERLRERFDENGLKAFSDVEALELLLIYALPRCSTNEIAHRLLDRFGGYRQVLEADVSELCLVKGVGENTARLIRLVSQMNMRYLHTARDTKGSILDDTEAAVDYLRPLFEYSRDELAYAVTLNSGGKVIRCHTLARGMSNRVEFSARQIVEISLGDNAAYVVLAHNHISDVALPSRADVSATTALAAILKSLGVMLVDHFIISGDEYVSMRESGYFIAD